MKLKLHENIKSLRRERGLTQEKLAEALGVTVGAVSKWENGNNTPDIIMLGILADFFDVSVDVLIGYDMSSKRVSDIVDRINILAAEHKFEDAITVSKDAITRYPHDFGIIFTSGMMYNAYAWEHQNVEMAKTAIKLLEESKLYISQNTNPDINEFSIDSTIALNYIIVDEKEALERYKRINFGGINNSILALVYLQNDDIKESLNYSTLGMVNALGSMFNSSTPMIISLASTGSKKNIESALDLADTILVIIEKLSFESIGYYTKMEATYHILKAYLYACLNDDKEMENSVRISIEKAKCFDSESRSNDAAKDFRFYYAHQKSFITIDSIGEKAFEGIDSTLKNQFFNVPSINKKAYNKLMKCWKSRSTELSQEGTYDGCSN
jgi:transcriptional regulator with XRE-family HTH domain